MATHPGITVPDALRGALEDIVGKYNVITGGELVEIYSVDFSEQSKGKAGLIIKPQETQQVPEIMRLINAAEIPVSVRGGGMSYTQGYLPEYDGSIMIDTTALNRIVEINTEDMYITVETGITWKELYHALDGTGYHLRFGGTMSGERATVGGAIGNNATAVKRGEVVDNLIGLEVVLMDGSVIQTGSRATGRPVQPMQNYGPDLTGLFVHDAGIMGLKTQATFRIERRPMGTAYATFGFQDTHQLIEAMCRISRLDVVSDHAAFSEYHNTMFANEPPPSREEVMEMAKAVHRVAAKPLQGWLNLVRMARPTGVKFLKNWKHSLHLIVDANDQVIARRHMREVRKVATSMGGRPLPPVLTIALRAMPFYPVERLIVGAYEENNTFPSNRITSLSRARELYDTAVAFFDENKDLMQQHGLKHTIIFMCVHNDNFGIEPIIYWRDAMNPLRASVLTSKRREELLAIEDNPDTRQAAVDLRARLRDRLGSSIPGAHYQIGKFYRYLEDLRDEHCRNALKQVKSIFDPKGLLNPGGLGIDLSQE